MSDITKCKGIDCNLKTMCHRYTAEESEYQSYFSEPPFKDGECDMFFGNAQKQLLDQLKNIVNGKEN